MIIKSAGLNEAIEQKGYYGYDEYGHFASTNNLDGVRARPDRYGNTVKGTTELLPSTSRFCSAYDLVPTLLDLLGIEYNKNFYPGNSLFADIPEKIQVYDNMINVLEYYTLDKYQEVQHLKEKISRTQKVRKVLMSGSGPTVLGVYDRYSDAKKACLEIRQQGYEAYWLTSGKGKDVVRGERNDKL